MFREASFDRVLGNGVTAGRCRELDQMLSRIEVVPSQLRGHGVAIGGERAGLDEDLGAPAVGAEKARQHQVQIHGQRVHGDDFAGLRAGEMCEAGSHILMIGNPGPARVLMTQDRESGPVIELFIYQCAGLDRHQTQRVAAEEE